jgi:hypothetical protein
MKDLTRMQPITLRPYMDLRPKPATFFSTFKKLVFLGAR